LIGVSRLIEFLHLNLHFVVSISSKSSFELKKRLIPVFNIRRDLLMQDRMWRKNRTPNSGSTCVGTDLNRNFDEMWGSK
jgi:hypothetical protein